MLSRVAGPRVYGRSGPLFTEHRAVSYFAQLLVGAVTGSVQGVLRSEGGFVGPVCCFLRSELLLVFVLLVGCLTHGNRGVYFSLTNPASSFFFIPSGGALCLTWGLCGPWGKETALETGLPGLV